MNCPFCGHDVTEVKDSRPGEHHIRRRRVCASCGGRFTTHERVVMRDLTVVKKDGRRQTFDREKVARSIRLAMVGRPIDPNLLESATGAICRRLEFLSETEVASTTIGQAVLQELRHIDNVAFIRFASVYLNFQFASDFADFLAQEGLTSR